MAQTQRKQVLPPNGRVSSEVSQVNAATRPLATPPHGKVSDLTVLGTGFEDKPYNSILPKITGTATQGQTLTCSQGTWTSNHKTVTYAYQWKRDGVDIGGATAATRVVAAGDVTHVLSCAVTATSAGGSTTAVSAATATVT